MQLHTEPSPSVARVEENTKEIRILTSDEGLTDWAQWCTLYRGDNLRRPNAIPKGVGGTD
jgi:hypothetical protein